MDWLKVMKFSVIFAMLIATTYTGNTHSSSESVRYMKNSKFNFFMAPGTAIKKPRAMHIFTKNVTYYSIRGEYLQQEDGSLYVTLKRPETHENGKFLCSTIPGHRLLILKTTKQLDFIQAWSQNKKIMVDLTQSSSSSNAIWGDGTPYEDTQLDDSILSEYPEGEENVIYVFKNGILEASEPENTTARIICQVNLFVDQIP